MPLITVTQPGNRAARKSQYGLDEPLARTCIATLNHSAPQTKSYRHAAELLLRPTRTSKQWLCSRSDGVSRSRSRASNKTPKRSR